MLAQAIEPNSALSARVEKQILQIEEKEKDRKKNVRRKLREAVEMGQPQPQGEHQRHSNPQINKSSGLFFQIRGPALIHHLQGPLPLYRPFLDL